MTRSHLLSGLCGFAFTLVGPPGAYAESGAFESAQAPVTPPAITAQPAHRPRIGLVLAGGGAKGGAHVGVLKVLEEQHVKIDCIAGTSMGSLIGGGYAAGLSAADLEKFLLGIDWKSVVGGAGRRALEPIDQKRLDTSASTSVELGVKNGGIVTPAGLSNTSAIDDLLRTYVAQARSVPDFNKLPIPYRAVATDMITGKMVVLDHGDLATAMRASMAIPGAFAPVVWGPYILADGGQVRNIPVDVARNTCADIVIVVNLVVPPTPPEKLLEATQLVARSMDVMLEANENLSLDSLTDKDIRIDVPMGDIKTADFTRVPETIPLGYQAAKKVADRLAKLSIPEEEYAAWRRKVTTSQQVESRVAAVRFEGLPHAQQEYLRSLTKIRAGDEVTLDSISDDAMRMSAVAGIDSVSYRLEGDPANPTLVWMPVESTLGTKVLRPSLGVYGSGHGDFKFLVGAQYVQYWMNDLGAQWRTNLQLGYESLFDTSWYQPVDVAQRFFVEPSVFASRSVEDLYVDLNQVAVYRFYDTGGVLDFGVNFGSVGQVTLGYINTERRSQIETGVGTLPEVADLVPEVHRRDAGMLFNLTYDSKDSDTFATHGAALQIRYAQSDKSLGADSDWNTLEGGFRTILPFGRRNAVWFSVAGGTSLGSSTLPADRAFSLGGARTIPAYPIDALRPREYWLTELSFLRRLVDLIPVKSDALYGGFGLQAAGLYDRVDRVPNGDVYGVSAYIGGPTPLGTLTFGGGWASDSWGVWFSVGRPIGQGSILDEGLFR